MKKSNLIIGKLSITILTVFLCLITVIPKTAYAKSSIQEAIDVIIKNSWEGLSYMHSGLVKYLHPTVYIQGSLAYRSIEDLLDDSAVIATGKITGQSESFKVKHATSGWTEVHTDYYFTIDNVLKGEPYADTVNVRMEGGTVGNYTEIYSGSPEFNQEDEYLLFLRRPSYGGAVTTEGGYYTVYGRGQGTFALDSEGVYRNVETDEELPGKVFISPHLDEEVDPDKARQEQLEVYEENYRTGFITKEEYDRCVASLDIYAKIVE